MEYFTNVKVSMMHWPILGGNVCANERSFLSHLGIPPFSVHCICNQKCEPGHSLAFNTAINSAQKMEHSWRIQYMAEM